MKQLNHSLVTRALGALLLVTSFAISANAQAAQPTTTPPRAVILTNEYHVKPGVLPEYLEWIKNESRPMYLKNGAKRTEVYTTVFGDTSIVYVMEYFSSFADMTASKAAFAKSVGPDAMKAFTAKGTAFLSAPPRQVILRTEPELSWRNPNVNVATPPRYYSVTRRWIAPGRARDYRNYLKDEYLPLLKKSEELGIVTTSLLFGDEQQIFISRPMNDLSELDTPNKILKVISNDDLIRLQQLRLPGVVSKSDLIVIRHRDDLSISTKQSEEAAAKK